MGGKEPVKTDLSLSESALGKLFLLRKFRTEQLCRHQSNKITQQPSHLHRGCLHGKSSGIQGEYPSFPLRKVLCVLGDILRSFRTAFAGRLWHCFCCVKLNCTQMMLVASVGDQKGEGKGCLLVSWFFRASGERQGRSVQASEEYGTGLPAPEVHLLRHLSLREVS